MNQNLKKRFLNNIIAIFNQGNGFTQDIYSHVLSDAEWNRIEDCKTGDVSLFGDEENTFEESTFTTQNYLPSMEDVDEWGLYDYSFTSEFANTTSLWVRIKKGDNIQEFPLVYDTDESLVVVSSNPDFGDVQSNHITEEIQEAFESSEVVDSMTNMIAFTELSSEVEQYISNATESTDITS